MKADESLLQWFLRLNGFLTLPNFVLHPDRRRDGQRTEVDVIGVRFPHRSEFPDLAQFRTERPFLVFAEAKASEKSINESWLASNRAVLEDLLKCVGLFSYDVVGQVATDLRTMGFGQTDAAQAAIVLVASNDGSVVSSHPGALRFTWEACLAFIHDRFKTFHHLKTAHDQWDDSGKKLWELTFRNRDDLAAFTAAARAAFHLR